MNRRELTRNAVAAASQTLVQMTAIFLLYRHLVGQLGVEQFGIWTVVLATASATRLSELGLGGSVTKFVAAAKARGDDRRASEFLQTAALTLAVMLTLALVILYPLLTWLLPYVLPPQAVDVGRTLLPYTMASIWLGTVGGVWQSGLDGCLRSDVRAGLVVLCTLLFVALAWTGVGRYGLVGLAAAQVAQGAALLIVGWILVRRQVGRAPLVPFFWSWPRLKEMAGYGANVQIIATAMLLFEPTTKILLGRYAGLAAAGSFELAQQLVMRVRALIVETNRVIVPVLAAMGERGDDTRSLYTKNVKALLFIITPMFGLLMTVVPAFSELWFGQHRSDFVTMAVCLTIGWYVNSLTAPAYFAYLGSGQLRWLTVSHLVLGGTNAVAGILLARIFGMAGVLAAFVFSLLLGSLIPVVAYHRAHGLRWHDLVSPEDGWLVGVTAVAATLAVGGYLTASHAGAPVWTRILLLATTSSLLLSAVAVHPLAARATVAGRGLIARYVRNMG